MILADEPTGNLDEVTRAEIAALMENLWKERGLTLVVVTHDTQVACWAPRTAVINNGSLTVRVNRRRAAPGAASADLPATAGKT